jgi:hypothetical protein
LPTNPSDGPPAVFVRARWLRAPADPDELAGFAVEFETSPPFSAASLKELSDLLARNREGVLDGESQLRLDELMRVYEHGLLRKSQALREAVRRGLREPLVA